jgi:acetylornithine deacetylase/succinyl-diaminopimelate desuccinylase-like protein
VSTVDLDGRVAADRDRLVEEWRDSCRIPSVSGDVAASTRMADWIEERLRDVFDTTRRVEIQGYGPTLIATLAGHSPRRLLLYSHYDVKPAEDAAVWISPPFAAEIVDDTVVARGTCDDKADITARLQALRLWRETWQDGKPPYTLVWLCEGAEEVGSPGLDELLRANRQDLSAEWCLWESFIRGADGRPEVAFGCRGIALLALSVRTMAHDQHAAFSPVFRSAAVELAHALASLVDMRGNVLVDGFEAGVLPFDDAERAAGLSVTPPGSDEAVDERGPHLPGHDPRQLADRLLYTPTINISAMSSGDVSTGTGVVTSSARANVDLHLVPDQDPEKATAAVRDHLDRNGFGHVAITVRHLRRPAKSPVDTPLGRAAIKAAGETMGEPVVYPLLPGAGPARAVLDILGATTVSPAGTTRLASGIHAVNERGRIDDYLDHVRFSYRVLERLDEEIMQPDDRSV